MKTCNLNGAVVKLVLRVSVGVSVVPAGDIISNPFRYCPQYISLTLLFTKPILKETYDITKSPAIKGCSIVRRRFQRSNSAVSEAITPVVSKDRETKTRLIDHTDLSVNLESFYSTK